MSDLHADAGGQVQEVIAHLALLAFADTSIEETPNTRVGIEEEEEQQS